MKKIFLLITFFVSYNGLCQQDSTLKLDLLKAPSSPGFILLNQQPTDIERPTTPTDFAVSFRNSSSNFSAIPKNYAVEMAPLWLFSAKKIGFKKAYGDSSHLNVWENIKQTFNLSVAYAPVDSALPSGASQFGFGFKFSIVRGKINHEFTDQIKKLNVALINVGIDFHNKAEVELKKDSDYVQLNRLYKQILMKPEPSATDIILINTLPLTIEKLVDLKGDQLARDYKNENETARIEITKKLAKMDVIRTGAFLDLAAGAVLDFPTRNFDYSEINKYGAWLTGGYDGNNWSVLALGRMLQGIKTPYLTDSSIVKTTSSNTFDLGLRLLYKRDKFNVSLEGLYRNYLNSSNFTPGYKGTFYLGYDLGNNKILTLNISRDFDGTVNKTGNLVTALNLIIGLGGNRNIKN
jgi:hypothetical protein